MQALNAQSPSLDQPGSSPAIDLSPHAVPAADPFAPAEPDASASVSGVAGAVAQPGIVAVDPATTSGEAASSSASSTNTPINELFGTEDVILSTLAPSSARGFGGVRFGSTPAPLVLPIGPEGGAAGVRPSSTPSKKPVVESPSASPSRPMAPILSPGPPVVGNSASKSSRKPSSSKGISGQSVEGQSAGGPGAASFSGQNYQSGGSHIEDDSPNNYDGEDVGFPDWHKKHRKYHKKGPHPDSDSSDEECPRWCLESDSDSDSDRGHHKKPFSRNWRRDDGFGDETESESESDSDEGEDDMGQNKYLKRKLLFDRLKARAAAKKRPEGSSESESGSSSESDSENEKKTAAKKRDVLDTADAYGIGRASSRKFKGFAWPQPQKEEDQSEQGGVGSLNAKRPSAWGEDDFSSDDLNDSENELPTWLKSSHHKKHKKKHGKCPKKCRKHKHKASSSIHASALSYSAASYSADSAPTSSHYYPAASDNDSPSANASPVVPPTTLVTSTRDTGPSIDSFPTGDTLTNLCPKQCITPPYNPADINCGTTMGCATAGGNKWYCVCRAGYRLNKRSPKDFDVQFKVPGQPYVYAAPGETCDTLCDNQLCSEVLVRAVCV